MMNLLEIEGTIIMKVFMIGGTGLLGGEAAQQMIEKGW